MERNGYKNSSLDEYRKKRLGTNRISITADLLVDRTKINGKDYKEKLLEADLLLHYVSTIKYMNDDMKYWFPMTYIYRKERSLQIMQKMARKQHFEKVKILFNGSMKIVISDIQTICLR